MSSDVVQVKSASASYQALSKWKVRPGAVVQANSLLAIMQSETGSISLKSSHFGKVTKICVEDGAKIELGSILCEIEPCAHPIQLREMCAVCGADLQLIDPKASIKRSNSTSVNNVSGACRPKQPSAVALIHNRPDLLVDMSTGIELGRRERAELLSRRKLVLLVDLDQTLVHTTNDNIPADLPDVLHYQTSGVSHLSSSGGHRIWYHTKIRAGTKAFLERLTQRYELHIFTMGSRAYANAVADALDASRRLFARRILSRDECLDAFRKTANLHSLFPCGDQLVAIIDDREEVWSCAPNLVQVRPYVSPFDRLVTESECNSSESEYLDRLASVLELIHSSFYDEFDKKSRLSDIKPESEAAEASSSASSLKKQIEALDDSAIPDLKTVMPTLKSAILRGVAIVFSCVQPRNVDPQRCFTYRIATQLGATVFPDLHVGIKSIRRSASRCRSSEQVATNANTSASNASVTEASSEAQNELLSELVLVCGKYGSSKQHEARGLRDDRIHIVTVEWLYETYFNWQRQPPSSFPVANDYDMVRYCEMPEPFYVRNWQLRLEKLREIEKQRIKTEEEAEDEKADTKVLVADDNVKKEAAESGGDAKELSTKVKLESDASAHRLDTVRDKKRKHGGVSGPKKRRVAPSQRQPGSSNEVLPLPQFSDDQLAEMEREIDEALCEDEAEEEEEVEEEEPRHTADDDGPMYGEDEDVPLGWTADEFERVGRPRKFHHKQRWRVTVANGDELKLGDTTTEDDDADAAMSHARSSHIRRPGRRTTDEENDDSRLDAGVRLLMNADNEMGDYACLTRMRCTGVIENDEDEEEREAAQAEERRCEAGDER